MHEWCRQVGLHVRELAEVLIHSRELLPECLRRFDGDHFAFAESVNHRNIGVHRQLSQLSLQGRRQAACPQEFEAITLYRHKYAASRLDHRETLGQHDRSHLVHRHCFGKRGRHIEELRRALGDALIFVVEAPERRRVGIG